MKPSHHLRYAGAIAVTVALGLASRRWEVAGKEPGDVLYAVLFYWLLRLAGVRRTTAAVGAFAGATAVECSKLLPWLDGVRATRLGGLVLGHAFLWTDIACYAVGAALAWGLDRPRVAEVPGWGTFRRGGGHDGRWVGRRGELEIRVGGGEAPDPRALARVEAVIGLDPAPWRAALLAHLEEPVTGEPSWVAVIADHDGSMAVFAVPWDEEHLWAVRPEDLSVVVSP